MFDLFTEIARFRQWFDESGEWEYEYENWPNIYDAVMRLVDAKPFANWSLDELNSVLYALARDNEAEHLANEIRIRKPETLFALAQASIDCGEFDAKWQIADQLGQLSSVGSQPEVLLLLLVRDADEDVRRRSLQSLARLGSSVVEKLAAEEWNRPGPSQEYSRMNALWCLNRIGSPHLPPLLEDAERDERPYLSACAKKIKRGEADA